MDWKSILVGIGVSIAIFLCLVAYFYADTAAVMVHEGSFLVLDKSSEQVREMVPAAPAGGMPIKKTVRSLTLKSLPEGERQKLTVPKDVFEHSPVGSEIRLVYRQGRFSNTVYVDTFSVIRAP